MPYNCRRCRQGLKSVGRLARRLMGRQARRIEHGGRSWGATAPAVLSCVPGCLGADEAVASKARPRSNNQDGTSRPCRSPPGIRDVPLGPEQQMGSTGGGSSRGRSTQPAAYSSPVTGGTVCGRFDSQFCCLESCDAQIRLGALDRTMTEVLSRKGLS